MYKGTSKRNLNVFFQHFIKEETFIDVWFEFSITEKMANLR